MKLAALLVLLSSILLVSHTSYADSRTRLSYLVTQRGSYVFRASESTKVDNLGLALGRDFGTAGKSSALGFLGGEASIEIPIGVAAYTHLSTRWTETSLQLNSSNPEQRGVDAYLGVGVGLWAPLEGDWRAGVELGLRGRAWILREGPIENAGHGGFTLAARLESEKWEGLFELGAMAIGIATPAELGVQRDASTLRARVGYFTDSPKAGFAPFLEFFHTHRDYYATRLLAGETALFIDEAKLVLGIGWIL